FPTRRSSDLAAVHVAVGSRGAVVGVQQGQRAGSFRHVAEEVEQGAVGAVVLVRVRLERVDHVGELDRIADEEGRGVVAHQIPVAVFGVELGGETTRVAQGFRAVVAVNHGGEAHEYRGGLAFTEQADHGQVRQVGRGGEFALGAGTTGLDYGLPNASPVVPLRVSAQ